MPTSRPATRPAGAARSLTSALVNVFKQQFKTGLIKPGDKLPPEAHIMREQGVSRAVVREAISQLQACCLVETRHGVGTFVLDKPDEGVLRIDPETVGTLRDVLAVIELRISLEVEAAGLAAVRRTTEQLDNMHLSLAILSSPDATAKQAAQADSALHQQIAQATDNRYFVEIMSHLGSTLIPRTRLNSADLSSTHLAEYMARINREHQTIVESIANRDPSSARAAMLIHLSHIREHLRQAHALFDQDQNNRKIP